MDEVRTSREKRGNRLGMSALAVGLALTLGPLNPGSPAAAASLTAGQVVVVEGRILSMDFSAHAVDGDGLIAIVTDKLGEVVVHIPSGEAQCPVTQGDIMGGLRRGDRVRATAKAKSPSHVEVCAAGTRLQKLK